MISSQIFISTNFFFRGISFRGTVERRNELDDAIFVIYSLPSAETECS